MANDITLRVTAKDDASRVLDGVDSKAKGLGSTFASVGKIAGGFLAANVVAGAAQKVVGFIGDSISAASNLEQSVGGVNSVFKDNAGTILDWGKNNASSFGLSQRAFAQMAGPLGAMLKNTGMDMGEVSGKTIDLTKRAADMAATFGGSVEDALTAVSAALRGETDPIERYGVSMSAVKVEAKALAMTGKTVASSLTDQEKAAARLALIFEQTADAEGQMARESDTAAGAAARQQAKMEDLQATLGQKLLPIQVAVTEAKIKMIEVITTKVIPVLQELYAKHWPAVSRAIGQVVAFIEENWPTIEAIITIVAEHVKTQIEGMIQTWEGIIQIITGVVETVKAIFEGDWAAAWEGMKLVAEGVLNVIEGTIKRVFGSIPGIIAGLAKDGASAAWNFGKDVVNGLADGVTGAIGSVVSAFEDLGRQATAGLWSLIRSGINFVIEKINGFIDGVEDRINKLSDLDPTGLVPKIDLPEIPKLATGMAYVPYDNYLALLHKGERVMTAAENSRDRLAGVGADVGVGGFAFNVGTMNVYEKDNREMRDVAFAVQATINNEVRRRGYLQSGSGGSTGSSLLRAAP